MSNDNNKQEDPILNGSEVEVVEEESIDSQVKETSDVGTETSVPLEDSHGGPIEDPPQRPPSHYTTNDKSTSSGDGRSMQWLYIAAIFFCLAVLVAILILILHFTIGQKDDNDNKATATAEQPTDPPTQVWLDPEWVKSIQERETTPLDPYDHSNPDCSLGNYVQPHVILQCHCQEQITVVADDIRFLYQELVDNLYPLLHPNDTRPTITSCHARNLALLWLASGSTTRAASEWLDQRYVMAVLYNEWSGTDWDEQNLWWSDNAHECTWLYVTCNSDQQVVSLGMDEMHLYGTIPTELALLSELRGISVTRNHLSGTVPTELFLLTKLKVLSFYDNELTGSIPSHIQQLSSSLLQLRLEKNELSGSLTTQIGALSELMELSLGFNAIQEDIPSEIGYLTQLVSLSLEENRFSKVIPTSIGMCTQLREVYLSECLLSGPLPSTMGLLTELEVLQLFGSGLAGSVPTEWGNMVALHRLDINDNKLTGPFPSELGQVTELYYLTANENLLTGSIPTEFGLLTNMTRMEIFGNDLSGTVPSELGEMTLLDLFQLYHNPRITGTMPDEVCALHETGDLTLLMVQCPRGDEGVECPDDCCRCRPGK
ncbi:LRR receptor-like serine threonine-protein kinase At4g08850-like [Seminavis robusta]|uniref:LRR receptor-like serine threonine-protein kinase At4g08850-like n=1 Tax=Seminavis robusta TaxID=568900 RepID=A0A9N8HDP1_9STRA|nr:LRR receptor-like serine threonine-protein kinase At4g08850-like [Seminavis robusta]|eukprot:Sro267_g103370.1 LRR receptor-like serine threonine-protein kinase At4g08850-like (600) ;mRNA; r:24532-26498